MTGCSNAGLLGRKSALRLAILAIAGAMGAAGCSKGESFDALFVEITAPAGTRPDEVFLAVMRVDDAGVRHVIPRDPDQYPAFTFDVSDRDLSIDPWVSKLVPGPEFAGQATVVVVGRAAGRGLARGQAEVDLSAQTRVRVTLVPTPDGCDEDGDGFPDAARPECCTPADGPCDCDDHQARATPVGYEDECTRCGYGATLAGDTVDDDCDGTPARCRDADNDNSKDCLPAWCSGESAGSAQCQKAKTSIDCDPTDPTTYPGAPEICDGRDNNCNGQTDEPGAATTLVDWDGQTKNLGEPCGTGLCAGGKVECDPAGKTARCSTASLGAAHEDCSNADGQGQKVDDNCNGFTDDPVKDGCEQNDQDGDGVEDAIEDKYCGPLAKFHSEIFPEHSIEHPDVGEGVVHSTPEPCCLEATRHPGTVPELCDWNCDGKVTACAAEDADGDGYPVGPDTDCDDTDPHVHAGAVEKCGDGVDQDCKGGDQPCSQVVDKDGDGFGSDVDCDDNDSNVNPWAQEICNGRDDNCNGLVDEGNPDLSGKTDQPCGSVVGECRKGVSVCVHKLDKTVEVQCLGGVKPADELCDLKDNDCNGQTDETFAYAGKGVWIDPTDPAKGANACAGVGECAKVSGGVIECRPDHGGATCSTNPDGSNHQDKAEVCDNLDNNCNGQTDENLTSVEQSDCRKTGVCGLALASIAAKCNKGVWSCDYSAVPDYEDGVETSCDEKDNDCDGKTDEDFRYSDAVNPIEVGKGAGCGTGACANGTVVCSKDQTRLFCDTSLQLKSEACDGLDNDCNGKTDEGFAYLGSPVWVDPSDKGKGHGACTGVGECGKVAGFVECQDLKSAGCSTNPNGSASLATKEVCDNLDNDCNGTTDDGLNDVADSDCRQFGVCATYLSAVKASCVAGLWSCDYDGVLGYEAEVEKTCDGKDNDCDGSVDEDFVLTENASLKHKGDGCGQGVCSGGSVQCKGDGSGVECSTAWKGSPEICDGVDNDCNGKVDDGVAFNGVPVGKQCAGTGECGKTPGIVECSPAHKAVCSTNPDGSGYKHSDEACNNKDDDCDGLTDDGLGLASADCPCLKVGQCSTGVVAVCAAGKWSCDYSSVTSYEYPYEASCDGMDNNCDGRIDEAFTIVDFDGAVKKKGDSCGTGPCMSGVVQCKAGGKAAECSTASKASAEKCDGIDNNCDGQTDEGTDLLCDDKIGCTTDTCTKGACAHAVQGGYCLIGGQCITTGSVNPQNVCQHCVAATSQTAWTYDGDATACDADGSGCTKNDACSGGTCKAGATVDCASQNTACSTYSCVSKSATTYVCQVQAVNEGTTCDDKDSTTCQDKCVSGACVGTKKTCDDSLACTDNVLGADCTCSFPVKTGCVIGTGASAVCVAEGAIDPTNPCRWCAFAANPHGYSARANGAACTDGNKCLEGETCQSGACQGGSPVVCMKFTCSLEHCDPLLGCQYAVAGAGTTCDDSDKCTVGDVCDAVLAKCNPGPRHDCPPSGVSCASNLCDGAGGCALSIQSGYCMIGGACWGVGQRQPGNDCTWCQAADPTHWTNTPTGSACSDANPCTAGDHCDTGACISTGMTSCEDFNPCTTDGCDTGSGCTHVALADGTDCNDGTACTAGDKCASGACVGTPMFCPEPNPNCYAGACTCGGAAQPCNLAVSDRCDGSTCTCSGAPACSGKNPACKLGLCKCGNDICGDEANNCTAQTCMCGAGPGVCLQPNPICQSSGNCGCGTSSTRCNSQTADQCNNGACLCGGNAACDSSATSRTPTCISKVCSCSSGVFCNSQNVDRCRAGACVCGNGGACGGDTACCYGGVCSKC